MHDTQAVRTCRNCDYDLRGLDNDALCPECALPVRDSALPVELALPDWRIARAIRAALALYVTGLLITTLLTISTTLILRYLHAVVPAIGPVWSRILVVQLWVHGLAIGWIVTLMGMAIVSYILMRGEDKRIRRTAKLTLILLLTDASVTLLYRYGQALPLPTTPDMTTAVAPALIRVLVLAAYMSSFWLLLLRCISPIAMKRLWPFMLLGTAGLTIHIAATAPSWYHYAFFNFCSTSSWVGVPWQVTLPWPLPDKWAHILSKAGSALMLVAILAILRVLNQARRIPQRKSPRQAGLGLL